jgi:hypothetical protein
MNLPQPERMNARQPIATCSLPLDPRSTTHILRLTRCQHSADVSHTCFRSLDILIHILSEWLVVVLPEHSAMQTSLIFKNWTVALLDEFLYTFDYVLAPIQFLGDGCRSCGKECFERREPVRNGFR